VDSLAGDVLVLPFFESDRPLRGPAARADWRLCGLLSTLLEEGGVRGVQGEAVLLPSGGRLRAPLVLAMGLGPRPAFGADQLRAATAEAVARVADLNVRGVVFALPAQPGPGTAAERVAEAWLEGVVAACRGLNVSLSLSLLVADEAAASIRRGLVQALSRLQPGDLSVHWIGPRASAGSSTRPEPSQDARRGSSTPQLSRSARS
jgi:hypothetical protein